MDTTALTQAYDELLRAADTVAGADAPSPPSGEWDADQVLGHLVILNAATMAAACATISGAVTTYDNRLAQDPWTIAHAISSVGGNGGLRDRIRGQAAALTTIVAGLSDAELDTMIPTLLVSDGELLVHDQLPLRSLLDGLAGTELPGHAAQLLALLPTGSHTA